MRVTKNVGEWSAKDAQIVLTMTAEEALDVGQALMDAWPLPNGGFHDGQAIFSAAWDLLPEDDIRRRMADEFTHRMSAEQGLAHRNALDERGDPYR